jgi:hypothetical protein
MDLSDKTTSSKTAARLSLTNHYRNISQHLDALWRAILADSRESDPERHLTIMACESMRKTSMEAECRAIEVETFMPGVN